MTLSHKHLLAALFINTGISVLIETQHGSQSQSEVRVSVAGLNAQLLGNSVYVRFSKGPYKGRSVKIMTQQPPLGKTLN